MKIYVKYFSTEVLPLEKISQGDWVDLRAAGDLALKAGEFAYLPLGVGMILPEGFEAQLAPRSSTFKNYGIIVPNSPGVIDSSYCGEEDEWKLPVYALRDTVIRLNDRVCQFRLVRQQPELEIVTVEHLHQESRGGFGSTGTR
ncbi:MAG: deoxyuridine 5'-triphosphate nucleotidohydrolase [Oscillospiraceae bacterium]|nr:deoxyuridine 5'-triphosphate nucleotidohydrolase [Oscillospiraceae bacterium]